MAKEEKRLLIRQATKLATLGLTVERERSKLKKLVESGAAYDSPEVLAALQRFQKADSEWKRLESAHIALRNRLGIE